MQGREHQHARALARKGEREVMLFGYICCGLLLLLTALLSMIALGIREILWALRGKSWMRATRGAILLVIPLVVLAWLWDAQLRSAALCFQSPYRAPAPTFGESDMPGTWEAIYTSGSVDRLIFRADGTFKQIYYDVSRHDHVQETTWNAWWLERLPDHGVRVHLRGARYYPKDLVVPDLATGVASCADDDPVCRQRYREWPSAFWDPIAEETVPMQGALVLNVRVDLLGQPLLHHMRTGPKQLVAITDCQAEHFRRVEGP